MNAKKHDTYESDIALARAEGALAEFSRQLRVTYSELQSERQAHRETRGQLGDLCDAVDHLTTLSGDDLVVAVDDLSKSFLGIDAPGERATRYAEDQALGEES
jgi:hypothetical protein